LKKYIQTLKYFILLVCYTFTIFYRREQIIKTDKLTLPGLFSETVRRHTEETAFAYVDGDSLTYLEADRQIGAVMAMMEKLGVKPGDRVAILSANMPNWALAYFATTFMKAVAVPILHEFSAHEIENILSHSGAKVLFVSEKLKSKMTPCKSDDRMHRILLDDFTLLSSDNNAAGFKKHAHASGKYKISKDDLATIIYTSGTTGNPKGVMLTHENICSNTRAGGKVQSIDKNDRFLSVLPLSHTYENTLGLILPMMHGASVYYLKEKPVASVLLPAMKSVRPTMMLTVPLIIEKIYRTRIKPALNKNFVLKMMHGIPLIRKKMHQKAGAKLLESFGGQLKFFGIGGAKLDREVEQFLINAKFPYAIGYGLTESSPLLAGVNPQTVRLQSTGPAVEGVQLKINEPDPQTGVGEI